MNILKMGECAESEFASDSAEMHGRELYRLVPEGYLVLTK